MGGGSWTDDGTAFQGMQVAFIPSPLGPVEWRLRALFIPDTSKDAHPLGRKRGAEQKAVPKAGGPRAPHLETGLHFSYKIWAPLPTSSWFPPGNWGWGGRETDFWK